MTIRVATEADAQYAEQLCQWYVESAKTRGTGIAKREPDYVAQENGQRRRHHCLRGWRAGGLLLHRNL